MYVRETYFYLVALSLFGLYDSAVGCSAPDAVFVLLHAVDIELKLTTAVDIDHILARLLGRKCCLVFCRKAFQRHARSKVVHTGSGNSQRRGVILRGDGLACHLAVLPERTLQSFLALKAALTAHQALHHFVVGQVTAGEVQHFLLHLLNTIENGHSVVGHTVVVAPHHRGVVGIGANNGNLLCVLLQG